MVGVVRKGALWLAGWLLLASLPLLASDRVAIQRSGSQSGHYLIWIRQPILLIGDSVTQGWMECGENFDQAGYVDALAERGINLLMLWAYKGTNADAKVDVVTLHPRDWVGHFPVFAGGYRRMPPKPYLYSEPVPEFDGAAPSLGDVGRPGRNQRPAAMIENPTARVLEP